MLPAHLVPSLCQRVLAQTLSPPLPWSLSLPFSALVQPKKLFSFYKASPTTPTQCMMAPCPQLPSWRGLSQPPSVCLRVGTSLYPVRGLSSSRERQFHCWGQEPLREDKGLRKMSQKLSGFLLHPSLTNKYTCKDSCTYAHTHLHMYRLTYAQVHIHVHTHSLLLTASKHSGYYRRVSKCGHWAGCGNQWEHLLLHEQGDKDPEDNQEPSFLVSNQVHFNIISNSQAICNT